MLHINREYRMTDPEWEKILKELHLRERLVQAETIVVKPNFAAGTYVDPDTHVISDRELIRSAIEFFVRVNPKAVIYLAESDSTGYGFAYLKFEHLELPQSLGLSEEAAQRVRLLDLSRDRLQRVESKQFLRYTSIDRQLWISETLLNADLKVDLSNLKTHSVTGYTGACKNLFGCLPELNKYHHHPYIHPVVHDLVLAIRPDLCVVDAFRGMEQNGPVNGIGIDSGYRVFSDDPFEADVYAASTIGYRPKKIRYLKLLAGTLDRGLDSDAPVVQKYRKPAGFLRVMNAIGLAIQRFGIGIGDLGHRIHTSPTPVVLLITLVRPLLLKIFDYEQLKSWKRKLMK